MDRAEAFFTGLAIAGFAGLIGCAVWMAVF
jgi:hypothetical protein